MTKKYHVDWDKVDLHFLKTYYQKSPQDPPLPDENGFFLGFISPLGKYYPTRFRNHDGTARAIVATLYNRVESGIVAREWLLNNGWIQILGKDHVVGRDRIPDSDDGWTITSEQVDVIRYIESVWDEADFYSIKYRKIVPSSH